MTDYKSIIQQREMDVYARRDVVLVRGKGARLWDDQGNEYPSVDFDFYSDGADEVFRRSAEALVASLLTQEQRPFRVRSCQVFPLRDLYL